MEEPKNLSLNIRIPSWAKNEISFKLNGEELSMDKNPGSFANISREFKNGDVLEFNFEFSLYVERMPDRPEYVAVKYGPNLLVACTLPNAMFVGDEKALISSLTKTKAPCEFRASLTTGKVVFKPINKVVDEVYNGYTIVSNPIKEIVNDEIIFGDSESEKNHEFSTLSAGKGFNEGKVCYGGMDGSMSLKLKVVRDKINYLKCLYSGSEISGNSLEIQYLRLFDIMVFDKNSDSYVTIATQKLNNANPGKWYDVIYPIPEALTKNVDEISIKLVAKPFANAHGYLGKLYEKICCHTYNEIV